MAYTTRQNVEQYLNADLSSVDSWVTTLIAAAKLWIDKYCGKTFEGVSADRYYDGNGTSRLLIDAFTGSPTVTVLESDGTTLLALTEGASEDFVTYPLNSTEKNEIVLMVNNQIGCFPNRKRSVKVTAVFGAGATVPDDVKLAATIMVSKVCEKRLKGGTPSSESLGDYSISFKTQAEEDKDTFDQVEGLLDHYRDLAV